MLGLIVILLALIAITLNIHKRRECFIVWTVGNVIWIIDFLTRDPINYPYIVLAVIYTAFNVYGWNVWSKNVQKRTSIS